MVDSLDELLEILETEEQKARQSNVSKRSDLALDGKEISLLDLDNSSVKGIRQLSRKPPKKEKMKCCPTFVGGNGEEIKYSNSITVRTCSALHCRDCDFPVSTFADYEWVGNVEYLFLRTNMPDLGKILQKLRRKKRTVAYACHCTSFSASKLQPLHEINLPWFCKGHF